MLLCNKPKIKSKGKFDNPRQALFAENYPYIYFRKSVLTWQGQNHLSWFITQIYLLGMYPELLLLA